MTTHPKFAGNVADVSQQINEAIKEAPAKLSLYDLADAQVSIDDLLDESGGELTPEIEERLEAIRGQFNDKVDRICELRQNRIRAAEACEAEAKRLSKRAEAAKRGADSLKTYLMSGLIRAGMAKLKTAKWTVWIQKSPASIRWTKALEELPIGFRRITVAADIEQAQALRKEGKALPDGFVVEQGEHIRIL